METVINLYRVKRSHHQIVWAESKGDPFKANTSV